MCMAYYLTILGTTWMQEIAYLILSEGDFEGAKSSTVLESGPFIEMVIPGEKLL